MKVSIQDILDAVKYVQEHAAELNVNPACVGFLGTSAGAHLAAVAAMTVPGTKALVGYSGIYDLEKAAITMKTKMLNASLISVTGIRKSCVKHLLSISFQRRMFLLPCWCVARVM